MNQQFEEENLQTNSIFDENEYEECLYGILFNIHLESCDTSRSWTVT